MRKDTLNTTTTTKATKSEIALKWGQLTFSIISHFEFWTDSQT